MGAPDSGIDSVGRPEADALLTFRTIKAPERARHEDVLNYWLSIRGDKEFPPLHDLDPLEISDAGPSSILFELIGGGQDAEIRHLGEALKNGAPVERIIDAPNPSILCSIAKKLPIVAISRDFLAFEDSFSNPEGSTRCWVTLLPLSSCGSWVDYVYAFVSFETTGGKVKAEEAAEPAELAPNPMADEISMAAEVPLDEADTPVEAIEPIAERVEEIAEDTVGPIEDQPAARGAPGFSKLIEGFANLTGFYGQAIKVDPVVEIEQGSELEVSIEIEQALELEDAIEVEPAMQAEPVADVQPAEEVEPEDASLELEQAGLEIEPDLTEQPAHEAIEEVAPEPQTEMAEAVAPEPEPEPAPLAEPEPMQATEGALQSKLTEVRARAEEARKAQLSATAALHQGLSQAYDFAIDAEASPEEYLRLVEAQGLKIQLRAPMAPVVKLAFGEAFDPNTVAHLEAVLAWALKEELPRGALLERIEQAGGISELLNQVTRPA